MILHEKQLAVDTIFSDPSELCNDSIAQFKSNIPRSLETEKLSISDLNESWIIKVNKYEQTGIIQDLRCSLNMRQRMSTHQTANSYILYDYTVDIP